MSPVPETRLELVSPCGRRILSKPPASPRVPAEATAPHASRGCRSRGRRLSCAVQRQGTAFGAGFGADLGRNDAPASAEAPQALNGLAAPSPASSSSSTAAHSAPGPLRLFVEAAKELALRRVK